MVFHTALVRDAQQRAIIDGVEEMNVGDEGEKHGQWSMELPKVGISNAQLIAVFFLRDYYCATAERGDEVSCHEHTTSPGN